MRKFTAILTGKTINVITRGLNLGGGSSAPGLYALKIYPELIDQLIGQVPYHVVITGTNGKTTTARLLAHFASSNGLKVIRNTTGSNLERGIASTLISQAKLLTKSSHLSKFNLGIWELDEAAVNSVAKKLNPKIMVFLNVFRDQLDRYGEVNNVVKKWSQTLQELDSTIILNGDDTNISKLGQNNNGPIIKFSIRDKKILGEGSQKTSSNPDFEVKDLKLRGLQGSEFTAIHQNKSYRVNLQLPGLYHVYDFLAAFSTGITLGFDPKKMIQSLVTFSPAFGRVEKFTLPNGKEGYIFLIKNPVGATQVFETINTELKTEDRLLIALNDNLADGTDVSWIWDAEFEKLLQPSLRGALATRQSTKVFVSGSRAYDLALRLKYAGFEPNNIKVEPELKKALQGAKTLLKGRLFILPTYTALLDLQRILTQLKIKPAYWKEKQV